MKRALLVLWVCSISFVQVTLVTAASSIAYGCASMDDLPAIAAIYDDIERDDEASKSLLLYPLEVRESILADLIERKRLFVARDTACVAPNDIVAFCKLYIVPSKPEDELLSIICDELGAASQEFSKLQPCIPMFADLYRLTQVQVENFAARLEPASADDEPYSFCPGKDVYIYYGSAYTKPEYREGKHLNTELELYALASIRGDVDRQLERGAKLFYTYGVVKKNFGKQARLRSFAEFVRDLLADRVSEDVPLPISFIGFPAHKPVIEVIGERPCASPVGSPKRMKAPKGCGCFLSFRFL
jgi:hypothetical protein